MQHVYRLDEAATAIVATAADIARSTLARHAAEVDARPRFPEESVTALAREGLLGLCVATAPKSWVTAAAHADSYVSSAQRPGAASPLESVIYLVRRNAPGVRVIAGFDGLGLRGNDSSPVALEGLALGAGDLDARAGWVM